MRRSLCALLWALPAAYAAAVLALHPWYRRWGATDAERVMPLPGDDLMHHAGADHAVTIRAPAEAVWPWLAQIGQDRGGFYSYTALENLVLAGIHNADRVHPEWQHLAVGDHVRLAQARVYGDRPLLRVAAVRPNRHLVLEGWGAFVLHPVDARTCRLHIRSHGQKPKGLLAAAAGALLFAPAHFIMERKMLLGIKRRAERAYAAARASGDGRAGAPPAFSSPSHGGLTSASGPDAAARVP